MNIILASTSKQRKLLMEKFKIPFTVVPSEYEEIMDESLSPEDLVLKLSQGKAHAVAKKYNDAIIIGADTFVIIDNKYLGKPKTAEDAFTMLKMLVGKTHTLITGFTLINTSTNEIYSDTSTARITMRVISDKEIREYVENNKPYDKAGGYSIEGQAGLIIEKVDGDFYAVLGLPVSKIAAKFTDCGIEYHF